MITGFSAFGFGTFMGRLISPDGALEGEIRDVEGSTVAVISGQVTPSGLAAQIYAYNGEEAHVNYAPLNASRWYERVQETLLATAQTAE